MLRVYIFKQKKDVVVDGRIVEIIGDKDFITKNRERLPELYRRELIPGFNGVIFGYDMHYNYLDGYNFKDGSRTDEVTYIQRKSPGATNDPSKGRIGSTLRVQDEDEEGCWNVYWDTYTYGCNCWTSSEYLYTYCIVNNGDNGDNGDGGGDWIPPGGTGGGSNTPPNDPSSAAMYVNSSQLETPCLINIWNTISSANFNNKVQNILFDFNESKNLQFILKEHNSINDRTAATVTPHSSGIPTISFNKWALRNASQEAIVAIIFHEVLHVFLDGKTNDADHNDMAENYIEPIANALEYWFPNINNPGTPPDSRLQSSSVALVWAGLENTDAWNMPIILN